MKDAIEEVKNRIDPKYHHLLLEPGPERTAPIVKGLFEDYNAMRWPFRSNVIIALLRYIYFNLTGETLS